MPTNRVIYNNQLLFTGPAPASGYYFTNTNGDLLPDGQINLIQPVQRLDQFSYQINTSQSKFSEIGNASTVYDFNLVPPEVNLNFSYKIRDLRNEARLGFYVKLGPPNLDQFDGNQVYPSGNILSGFSFSDNNYAFNTNLVEATNNTFKYPFKYRDQRNLFLVINPDANDVIGNNVSGFPVLAFGNCYMTSYSVNLQVGNFPQASLNYVADNLIYYSSGVSGVSPYLNPKSGTLNTGIKFNIPNYDKNFEEYKSPISVLLPGEVTIDVFDSNSLDKTKTNLVLQDAALQSFSFTIPLDRESLKTLGHVYPVDRQINTPIIVDGSFSAIYKNLLYSGSPLENIKDESEYDIAVKLNKSNETIIRYDFKKAKLKTYTYESSIGSNASISYSFYCDMDMNSYPHEKGLFISGLLKGFDYTNYNSNGLI